MRMCYLRADKEVYNPAIARKLQESLVAFIDVIQATRETSGAFKDAEWPLDDLTRLMAILKGSLHLSALERALIQAFQAL